MRRLLLPVVGGAVVLVALTACGTSAAQQGPSAIGASGTDYSCYSANDENLRTVWNMMADAAGWARPSAVNSYTGQGDGAYVGAQFSNGVAVFAGRMSNGGSNATSWLIPVNPLAHSLFSDLPTDLQAGMTQNAPSGIDDANFRGAVGHLTDCLAES